MLENLKKFFFNAKYLVRLEIENKSNFIAKFPFRIETIPQVSKKSIVKSLLDNLSFTPELSHCESDINHLFIRTEVDTSNLEVRYHCSKTDFSGVNAITVRCVIVDIEDEGEPIPLFSKIPLFNKRIFLAREEEFKEKFEYFKKQLPWV